MNRRFGTLLMVLPAVALAGCSQDETAAESRTVVTDRIAVEVAKVVRSQIRTSVDLVGTLLPIRGTTVVSDVDGIVESFPQSDRSIHYEENGQMQSLTLGLNLGHEVKAGDVLVQIDPTDFQLDLNVAKADLNLAKRNLDEIKAWRRPEEVDRLEAACKEAQAIRDRAKADLNRAELLVARNTIARSTYDASVMAHDTAVAATQKAEAAKRLYLAGPTPEQLAVTEARVASAQAEVEQKQEKLNKTTIKAKYDGVVSDRYVDVGDRVTAMPRVEIMQIVDPRILFAQVSVPERYQTNIKLGSVARITGDAVPGEVPATVELINSKVDPETRTFRARLMIDNRARVLKPGSFVNVELALAAASDVLVVPREAVTFTEGRPAVFVCRENRVRKTPVEIGISDAARYEIRSGLTEGDLVAVDRTSLLGNGMEIQAGRWSQEAAERPPVAMAEVRR